MDAYVQSIYDLTRDTIDPTPEMLVGFIDYSFLDEALQTPKSMDELEWYYSHYPTDICNVVFIRFQNLVNNFMVGHHKNRIGYDTPPTSYYKRNTTYLTMYW